MVRRTRHAAAVIAASLFVVPSVARAQSDDGPVIIGEQKSRYKGLIVDRFSSFLDFFTRYRSDAISPPGQDQQNNEEFLYRPAVGISTRAFVGHRNLLELNADLSIGLQNNRIDSETQGIEDQEEQTIFNTFNIEALILREGPAPTRLYAIRDQTLLDRSFAGSIDSVLTEVGGSVRTFQDVAPTTFIAFHREIDQDDLLGVNDNTLTQTTFGVQSTWRPTVNQQLNLLYAFDAISEVRSGGNEFEYTRNDGTLIHELDFTEGKQNRLRSQLRFFDQRGDFPTRNIRLFEQLSLEHTDTLDSRYFLTLERQTVRGQDQDIADASALVTHQLFDSLTTNLSAGANSLSIPDENFTSNSVFGRAFFNYTKRVPAGRLFTTVGLYIDQRDNSARGNVISIQNEQRTFNDPFPIIIDRRNIIDGSVAVKNINNTQTFVRNADYTQLTLPERLELRRVVTGQIADGQTVLIDYDLGPEAASLVTSGLVDLGLRYTVERTWAQGFSVFGNYRERYQEIESTDPTLIPNEGTFMRYGAEYQRGPFRLLAQWDDQDTTTSPFESMWLQATYDQRFGPRSHVIAWASHEQFEFLDSNEEITLNRLTGTWEQGLTTALDFRVRLQFRDEQSNTTGSSQGYEQTLELNWSKRQTNAFVSVSNQILESDSGDRSTQAFFFGVRRTF